MHSTHTSIAQCISQTIWENGNYSYNVHIISVGI